MYLFMLNNLVSPASEGVCRLDDSVFDSLCERFEAVKKFIPKDDLKVELSVLYSLQAIAVKHGVPKGLFK